MNRNPEKSRAIFEALHEKWKSLRRQLAILLVEDDLNDVHLIRHELGAYPVMVQVAFTGDEAIRRLGQDEYDLVLLDLKLQGPLQGNDVLFWAKDHKLATPFVILTGISYESAEIKEALNRGAECVIQKPLSPEQAKMILGGIR